MARAGERRLPHCHGGGEPSDPAVEPRVDLSFLSFAAEPLAQGPRPDTGAWGWAEKQEKKANRVAPRSGKGWGWVRESATGDRQPPREGKGGREESRGGGEPETRRPRPAPSTPVLAGSDAINDAKRPSEVTI